MAFLDNTGLSYLWGKITTALSGKLDTTGNAYRAASIPLGQVDSTSTATAFTVTVPGITELRDGVCAYIRNGVVTSASGFTVNVNGLGAKPCYSSMAAATRATTIFNVNYTLLFVYNEDRVSGGCWDLYYGYYSDANSIGYQLRTASTTMPTLDKFYRYRLLFTSADRKHFVPANASSSTSADTAKTVTGVTAAGSGSFTQGSFSGGSLTMTMDTTDTKKLNIVFTAATHGTDSHTHVPPTLATAVTITGVQASTTTASHVKSGGNGSAPTLGTAITVTAVSGNTDVTVPIKATSATTVPIKNTATTTVVTSSTHTVNDSGHAHAY